MKTSRINTVAGMAFLLFAAAGLLIVQGTAAAADLETEHNRIQLCHRHAAGHHA